MRQSMSSAFYTGAFPATLCLIFSLICLIKSFNIAKLYPLEIQENMKKTVLKIFLYPLVQLLSFLPALVYVYICALFEVQMENTIALFISLPLCFVGMINAIIYYFQQKSTTQNFVKTTEVLEDFNNSVSYLHENDISADYKAV